MDWMGGADQVKGMFVRPEQIAEIGKQVQSDDAERKRPQPSRDSAHEESGIAITARRLSPLPSFGSAPGPTCSALPAELRHGVGSLRVRSDGHPSDGCASSSPGPARCTRRLSCSLLRSIFSLYDATSLPFPSYRNDPQAPGLSRLVRSN